MTTAPDAPMTPREMAERALPAGAAEAGPYGLVTDSANVFWAPDGALEVVDTDDHDDAVRVVGRGALLPGLPVRTSDQGEVTARTLAERLDAAATRERRGREPRTAAGEAGNEPHRPPELPAGHPVQVGSLDDTRFGINSRGRRTLLSEAHSTIIDGESRSLVYPNTYPYTAVCKLYVRYQDTPGGAWLYNSEATGFMVGPRAMVTSGHVQPPGGKPWQIQVIPGCWNGQSVHGAGVVSYVSDTRWWNSDSGSDIQICRLYDPLGDTVGWFGTKNYDSGWEDHDYWTMAGFPYDINLTYMSHETAIAVRDDDDGDDINVDGHGYDTTQVESDADEASGASGSPLWGYWGGAPYAIGVHHGVEHDGTITGTETLSCASGGDGFLAAVNWARRLWG